MKFQPGLIFFYDIFPQSHQRWLVSIIGTSPDFVQSQFFLAQTHILISFYTIY